MGPPAQVGAGCMFGLLSWVDEGSKPARTRCFIAVAPCLSLPSLSLLLFLLLLLLLLHIPAVCLSALSQRWCETWRQGSWAASFCQLTLWPPALPPQLHVPMPQQGTTGHLYWVDSRCQQKSFHIVWVILNSTELVEESTSVSKQKINFYSNTNHFSC